MSSRKGQTQKIKQVPRSNGRASSHDDEAEQYYEPVLSGGMRDDLIGIALAVIGIVLFVAVVVPSNAPVTAAVADGLRHLLGLGAYIVPFAFVVWGASYFLKTTDANIARLVLALVLIVVSVMAMFSLFNAGVVADDASSLLSDEVLVGGGGYVGSGLAWLLMASMGRVIAAIILVALCVAGLVLAGLSVSMPFLFIKNLIFASRENAAQAAEFDASAHFGQGRRTRLRIDEDLEGDEEYLPDSDETILYGNSKRAALTGSLEDGDASSAEDTDATVALSEDGKTVKLGKKPTKRTKGSKKADKKAPADGATVALTSGGPMPLEGFELPNIGTLNISGKRKGVGAGELKQTAALLQQTLEEFSLPAEVVGWLAGPTVTMFKVDLPSGVKLSKLTSLADDIALALAADGVRIAQIPNTSLVGVEIPNRTRADVLLGDIVAEAGAGPLQMAIGEDVDGNKICLDLSKMPHLLVGGTTGSGKSVALNGFIMTILMRATPAEVRMILIDPKRVEFSLYNGIPHLYVPPVTEPKEAASALKWAVAEMERRLKLFEQVGARNIGMYNELIQKGALTDENGDHPDEIPYIVVVIDELSDLMMVAGKEVEDSIVRLSQLARAAGIHLIVATQRPSANIVTGMIKANITNRIALTVSTKVESRVIIDQSGAEKLTGHGDMLFSRPAWGRPKRIQGCYVSEEEISSVVAHLKAQGEPDYHKEILNTQLASDAGSSSAGEPAEADDPLLWEAADAVINAQLGSTSMLQRRLKVGYARAGRIMDMLEAKGVVGPQNGSKPRDILIDTVEDLEAIRAFEEADAEEGR